jgi:hypothetical protein
VFIGRYDGWSWRFVLNFSKTYVDKFYSSPCNFELIACYKCCFVIIVVSTTFWFILSPKKNLNSMYNKNMRSCVNKVVTC